MHISGELCLLFFQASCTMHVLFFKVAGSPFKQEYGILKYLWPSPGWRQDTPVQPWLTGGATARPCRSSQIRQTQFQKEKGSSCCETRQQSQLEESTGGGNTRHQSQLDGSTVDSGETRLVVANNSVEPKQQSIEKVLPPLTLGAFPFLAKVELGGLGTTIWSQLNLSVKTLCSAGQHLSLT